MSIQTCENGGFLHNEKEKGSGSIMYYAWS